MESLGAVVATLVIYKYISPFLSSRLVKTYRTLSHEDQVHWNSKMAPQVFCILFVVISAYGILGEEVNADMIWGDSPVIHLLCVLFNGYMIGDTVISTFLEPGILFDKMYLFHHSVGIASAVGVIASQSSAYTLFFRVLPEVSNIFLNLGWFLKKVYGKSSPAFTVSAALFALTFICSRIIVLPGYYYKYLTALSSASLLPPTYMLVITLPIGIMMDLLNLYWLRLIIAGFIKIVFPTAKKQE